MRDGLVFGLDGLVLGLAKQSAALVRQVRAFAADRRACALVNVGCCYNLLTEDAQNDAHDADDGDGDGDGDGAARGSIGTAAAPEGAAAAPRGFPVSSRLRGVQLGRAARMLACQSVSAAAELTLRPPCAEDAAAGDAQAVGAFAHATRMLMYRAVLQVRLAPPARLPSLHSFCNDTARIATAVPH